MRSRMTRFTPGARVRTNQRSPYRCAPAGAHGTVVEVGREVIYVNFPRAARLPMDPFELDTATPPH